MKPVLLSEIQINGLYYIKVEILGTTQTLVCVAHDLLPSVGVVCYILGTPINLGNTFVVKDDNTLFSHNSVIVP